MSNSDVQIPFPDHISHPIDDVNITKILAITSIGGRLIHYVQLEGGKKTLMPSTLTNVLVPQLVIEFYQNHISFVNIFNQRIRPIRKSKRRHARKSTNPRTTSTKYSPPSTSTTKTVTTTSSPSSITTTTTTTTVATFNQSSINLPKPSSSKSLLKDLASSLAKSLTQLKATSAPQPKQLQYIQTPEPLVKPKPKSKPKPLSKQQQSSKKPTNS